MGAYLGKLEGGDRTSKKKHVDHQGEGAGMKLIDLTEAKKVHTIGHISGGAAPAGTDDDLHSCKSQDNDDETNDISPANQQSNTRTVDSVVTDSNGHNQVSYDSGHQQQLANQEEQFSRSSASDDTQAQTTRQQTSNHPVESSPDNNTNDDI